MAVSRAGEHFPPLAGRVLHAISFIAAAGRRRGFVNKVPEVAVIAWSRVVMKEPRYLD